MSDHSKIEWCDATWNVVLGCSKVSAGCKNCYAIRVAHRLGANPQTPQYAGLTVLEGGRPNWTGVVRLVEERLEVPLHWRKPRRIFVNSESDLFHPALPDLAITKVLATIAACPWHTFMVLTKQPARMLAYFQKLAKNPKGPWDAIASPEDGNGNVPDGWEVSEEFECWVHNSISGAAPKGVGWPMKNLWLGVSVEDQKTANERIPLLLQTPAAVRWISAEPLLGPVDLRHVDCTSATDPGYNALQISDDDEGDMMETLDWVVVGGESGPGARPMHPEWARNLRDQCAAAGVPFFFKQWGAWAPAKNPKQGAKFATTHAFDKHEAAWPDGTIGGGSWGQNGGYATDLLRVGKKAAGRRLDGRLHNAFPSKVRA